MDRVSCGGLDLNAEREAAILAKWDRIEAEDLARMEEEADLDAEEVEIGDVAPAILGLSFPEIVRDTGLDRSQVRALLAHLGISWTFDGRAVRVNRDDYYRVRENLRSVFAKLESYDLKLSKTSPKSRRLNVR